MPGNATTRDARPASEVYGVRVVRAAQGWEVRILDAEGGVGFTRASASEAEARTLASTVKQHLHWLSAGKFAEYYRLPEPR